MELDFDKIKYFLKVVEKGSFVKAAEEMYITSQAINKKITLLETQMGVKLLERTTRSLTLTPAGKKCYEIFQPVYKNWENAALDFERQMHQAQKKIRINFFQGISKQNVLMPIINHLLAEDTELKIELEAVEIEDVYDHLLDGTSDLAITNMHDYEHYDDLEVVSFHESEAKIIVSLLHSWVLKDVVTLEDMENEPILLLKRKRELEEDSFFKNVKAKEYHYASNYNALLVMLEMGKEYAVFSNEFDNMHQLGLKSLDLPEELRFHFRICVLYRKDSPYKKLFDSIKILAEELDLKL